MEHCVFHYISRFLPLTEIWLYNQIRNHKEFKPVVICRKKLNTGSFPLNNVYSLEDLSYPKMLYNFTIFKSLGYFPYFKNQQKKYTAEIIHGHFGYNAYKSAGLSRILRKPLVCSFYGGDVFKYPLEDGNSDNYRKLFRHLTLGIVLGPYMKQSLIDLGCPEEKLVINHLGVEVNNIEFKQRSFSPGKPYRFLIASSFVEKKGIDIALKALKLLENEFDFTLEIIGDGPLKTDYLKLVSLLKLDTKVIWHGYRPYRYFLDLAYECDAYIQASKTAKDNDKEGTPMAIIDAMATGLPVIATRHSDIPETVDDGVTGFLATENHVEDLAEALKKFTFIQNDVSIMSKKCRLKIENDFNISKQVVKLEKLYSALL